jgi:hypothetical protein
MRVVIACKTDTDKLLQGMQPEERGLELCALAIPADMAVADFCNFCGAYLQQVRSCCLPPSVPACHVHLRPVNPQVACQVPLNLLLQAPPALLASHQPCCTPAPPAASPDARRRVACPPHHATDSLLGTNTCAWAQPHNQTAEVVSRPGTSVLQFASALWPALGGPRSPMRKAHAAESRRDGVSTVISSRHF